MAVELLFFLCCIDACVCIGLIMCVRACAQCYIPPPGSMGVPSVWYQYFGDPCHKRHPAHHQKAPSSPWSMAAAVLCCEDTFTCQRGHECSQILRNMVAILFCRKRIPQIKKSHICTGIMLKLTCWCLNLTRFVSGPTQVSQRRMRGRLKRPIMGLV